MLYKRAQVSDVMSWLVATLIIIGVLVIFIYASTLLAQKTKVLDLKGIEISFEDNVDFFDEKTSFAYLLASDSEKKIIDDYLGGKENE